MLDLPKAKKVPDDWREELKIYEDEQHAFFTSEAARTGSWVNPLSGKADRLAPSREEFVSYFQTILSKPEVAAAIERQWLRGEETREDEYEDRVDSTLMSNMAKWWAMKFINCSYDEHFFVSGELSYVHPGVVAFVRSGRIEKALMVLKKELTEKGRW